MQIELTKELFDQMRKGKQMVVAAMNIQQKTMGFPVPLTGFAKAYDGAPVDSVKYEESRRQLMEMFRKRQAELAAKAAKGGDDDRRGPASRRSASGRERHDGAAEEGAGTGARHSAIARRSSRIKKAASVSPGRPFACDRGARQCSCRKRKRKTPFFRSSNSSATCGWRNGSSEASGTRFCSET